MRVNCIAPIARTRMALAMPGAGEFVNTPVFDPKNISPLAAALAAEGCPFNGQIFSVVGGSVGIYAGWSIGDEVTSPDRWSVDGLIKAMGTLPRSIAITSQRTKIIEAIR